MPGLVAVQEAASHPLRLLPHKHHTLGASPTTEMHSSPFWRAGVQDEEAAGLGSGENLLSGSKAAPPCCVLTWQGGEGAPWGLLDRALMALLTLSPSAPPMGGGGSFHRVSAGGPQTGGRLQQRQVWPMVDAAELLAGGETPP